MNNIVHQMSSKSNELYLIAFLTCEEFFPQGFPHMKVLIGVQCSFAMHCCGTISKIHLCHVGSFQQCVLEVFSTGSVPIFIPAPYSYLPLTDA